MNTTRKTIYVSSHTKEMNDYTSMMMANIIGEDVYINLFPLQVLSTPPVFNVHTSYTAVMQARKNFYFTWIRYDAPKKED